MGKKLLGQRIRANLSFASNLMENIAHFCTCNSNKKERHFLSENIKLFKKSIKMLETSLSLRHYHSVSNASCVLITDR